MRWGEARELARMLVILGMLMAAGFGLEAKADGLRVVEVDATEVPAVEQPARVDPARVDPAALAEPMILLDRRPGQERPVGVPGGA